MQTKQHQNFRENNGVQYGCYSNVSDTRTHI